MKFSQSIRHIKQPLSMHEQGLQYFTLDISL